MRYTRIENDGGMEQTSVALVIGLCFDRTWFGNTVVILSEVAAARSVGRGYIRSPEGGGVD